MLAKATIICPILIRVISSEMDAFKIEQIVVVRFLSAKGVRVTGIHRKMSQLYGS